MSYYGRLREGARRRVAAKTYFDTRISNNLFYGLQNEYFVSKYAKPKPGLALRPYRLFSYPLRVLYYTICLYVLKLSQRFSTDLHRNYSEVRSWYGGNLRFDDNGWLLLPNTRTVYFLPHYKNFKNAVRREFGNDSRTKVAIELDVTDCYSSISVETLLQRLMRFVPASDRIVHGFDEPVKSQLSAFFRFVMGGDRGLPQADNDIVSSATANLYMGWADLLALEVANDVAGDQMLGIKVLRYVDDMFLFMRFRDDISEASRISTASKVATVYAGRLFSQLDLRLNQKSKIYPLDNADRRGQLERRLKKVSPDYYADLTDGDQNVPTVGEAVISEVETLAVADFDATEDHSRLVRDEILKDVFNESVRSFLKRPDNLARLRSAFACLDFRFATVSPLAFVLLARLDQTSADLLRAHLLQCNPVDPWDTELILRYLGEDRFVDREVIAKLQDAPVLGEVAEAFRSQPPIGSDRPGYWGLRFSQLGWVLRDPYVREQAYLRRFAEQRSNYALALSHLLNEVQATIRAAGCDGECDGEQARRFLISKQVRGEVVQSVFNLFQRRNINTVAHPGRTDRPTLLVDESEYRTFCIDVNQMIGALIDDLR